MNDSPLMVTISGCRGVVGASLTPATICRYVGALATWFEQDGAAERGSRIVVGRDGRAGGDVCHQVVIAQLRACGFEVIDVGVATTPTVGVAVKANEAAGGVVVTASHNPEQWNGVKPITREGRAPSKESAARIVGYFHESRSSCAPFNAIGGCTGDGAAAHTHVAKVLEAIETVTPVAEIKSRGFRVAVDSVNASGAAGARLLLDALGCELVHINAKETGVFPHPPEPTRENLSGAGGLRDAVVNNRCHVGFAQDPDADRLAILDERGEYIGEEYTLVFAADAMLGAMSNAKGAALAANLSTSRMIDDVAADHGAHVVRTPVGEAHVAQAMVDRGAIIGGEGNGGVIWPQVVLIRDSLGAMALTLALMTRSGASVSELVKRRPAYAIVKRKMDIEPGGAARAVSAIEKHWSHAKLDRQDGVRVDLVEERAWLHVRGSNTEPIVRLIAEAPDERAANRLLDEAKNALA